MEHCVCFCGITPIKWIVCFFGDLYCTELDLQGKFWNSNRNLVSIDRRILALNWQYIDRYQRILVSNQHYFCCILCFYWELCSMWILDVQRKYRTKFRYRSVSNKTWHRPSTNCNQSYEDLTIFMYLFVPLTFQHTPNRDQHNWRNFKKCKSHPSEEACWAVDSSLCCFLSPSRSSSSTSYTSPSSSSISFLLPPPPLPPQSPPPPLPPQSEEHRARSNCVRTACGADDHLNASKPSAKFENQQIIFV